MTKELKQVFDEARRKSQLRDEFTGGLGIYDGTTQTWTFDVPGKPGYVWVRPDFGGNPVAAYNDGTPLKPDLNVEVAYHPRDGHPYVKSVNHIQAIFYNPTNPPVSVPPATTDVGSGREEFTPGSMILDGLVSYSGTALTVNINGFTAVYNGALHFYTATTKDLTSYVPGTARMRCWCLVGYNPSTNTIAIGTSTPTDIALPLPVSDIATVAFAGKIPLGAVILTNGKSTLSFPNDFEDCRAWVTGTGITSVSVTPPITNTGTPTAPIIGLATDFTPDIASFYEYLATDVSMATAGVYYDSVSVGVPRGVWFIQGKITVQNAGLATFSVKLWDGTTLYSSGQNYSKVCTIPVMSIITFNVNTVLKISVSADVNSSTILSSNFLTQLTGLRIGEVVSPRTGTPIGLLMSLTRE